MINKKQLSLALILIGFFLPSFAKERIVTAGGSITEIIYELGSGDELVGVDMTSTYPNKVKSLPQIGYWKQLNIEGILSLKPSIFIAWNDSGPKLVFEQLYSARVNSLFLKRVPNELPLLLSNIRLIAKTIHRAQEGEQLVDKITAQVKSIKDKIQTHKQKPRVLFLLSVSNVTQVAGKNTVADSVITLSGGENIATHNNYKNYSTEAFITANPDVLILTRQSLDSIGGIDGLSKFPGLLHTNAWKNKRIIAIDQALILGMGPRVGETMNILYNGFYPE